MLPTAAWLWATSSWKRILGILSSPYLNSAACTAARYFSRGDKFATLELPYGIEGMVSIKNLAKEDGTLPEVGESLDFMVLEFSKEDKKILLSHTKVWQGGTVEPKASKKSSKSSAGSSSSSASSKDSDSAATTFGDLDVLSALKEQMEGSAQKGKKAAKPKKEDKPAATAKEDDKAADKKDKPAAKNDEADAKQEDNVPDGTIESKRLTPTAEEVIEKPLSEEVEAEAELRRQESGHQPHHR